MIVTINYRVKAKHPSVDCNFKIKVDKDHKRDTVWMYGSQLLLAGFRRHPYGAVLEKDAKYWLHVKNIDTPNNKENRNR